MSFLWPLVSAFFDVASYLWIALLRQLAPPPRRDDPVAAAKKLDVPPDRHLSNARRRGNVDDTLPPDVLDPKEDFVGDSSFLSQLEQRTQQVKITLANLEAEKVRIEGLITRLQPLVPHYDALLDAERSISEAQIALEEPPAPANPNPWEQQPQEDQGPRW